MTPRSWRGSLLVSLPSTAHLPSLQPAARCQRTSPHAPCPQVPKMLGALRSEWCPASLVVSFKLETDQQILLKKVCVWGGGWGWGGGWVGGCLNRWLHGRCTHASRHCCPGSTLPPRIERPTCPHLVPPHAGVRRHRGVRRGPGGGQRAAFTQRPGVAGGARGDPRIVMAMWRCHGYCTRRVRCQHGWDRGRHAAAKLPLAHLNCHSAPRQHC